MEIKNQVFDIIKNRNYLSLELGCGPFKKDPRSIGIDLLNAPGVDLVGDIFQYLEQFPDNSVDRIYSSHFFEHISDFQKLWNEITRVLRNGAELEIIVPHFSNPYYYSDLTHKLFFGLYSFCAYANCSFLKRPTPKYSNEIFYDLKSVDLIFKSPKPFYFRYAIRMPLRIFNTTDMLKEIYEDLFSSIFSCYEIKYVLKKI